MASDTIANSEFDWLAHVQPVGVVIATTLISELGLTPIRQTPIDTGKVVEQLEVDTEKAALVDPWRFFESVLGWEARFVAGSPGGAAIPQELLVALPEQGTVLEPTWAVSELAGEPKWQLLVRVEKTGIDPDARGSLDGWEASPHQRLERLLRGTGVFAGLLITDHAIRLVYAPRGETSGHVTFPIRALGTVSGRPMLGGLKLLLDRFRLFSDADARRLPSILKRSRDAQASVSSALAEQVLGALHQLLQGLNVAEPLIRELAKSKPDHLYEGLLTVLMRLVFVLYAEDRDLLPSRADGRAREVYESSYSVRGLYAKLTEDAAFHPDTMDERCGGWGRLISLFRLIHKGHATRFIQARGGKLFDPDEFPFLEGRSVKHALPRIAAVSDGCLLRILEGLMTLKVRGASRERLSYRTLDVEQIGSVYETVMGFTVERAAGRMLAIKAGKHNRTPVFVNLDELVRGKGKERIKALKENTGRGQLSASNVKAIEAAQSVEDLAAGLDSIIDERASTGHAITQVGEPILQPTDERRSTGSHYTPRSLTEPIVKYALAPAFERLGADATPEAVLELSVCDPAMGSGAFLVEACRAIGERLVMAWERWPDRRPVVPADEDEDLLARRLVAQRCLYGVDKNARAVDLARLSLWLATLARDHEFTFLDHALKCGDSLVGLTREQISALHWDSQGALPLFADVVRGRLEAAANGRREIREAPDDVARSTQETRFRDVEQGLRNTRLIGSAIVASFFLADKPRARELRRQQIEVWANGPSEEMWPKLEQLAGQLRAGSHPVLPFHWEIEFPEVFTRENGGFDAIVGNPPFAGKNTVIAGSAKNYVLWLQTLHGGAHGNSDLIAHFFRRAFNLLRPNGVFGLIATNTVSQGDTRETGLGAILGGGGTIVRATRRLKWPGEAAVVVSVVHGVKGQSRIAVLDGHQVRRISAYLVSGELDTSPNALEVNRGRGLIGSVVLGMGFTFDDKAAAKGNASSLAEMRLQIEQDPRNTERIFPYIGGEEVNSHPRQAHSRYVIDFGGLSETEAKIGWPGLFHIVERLVKPQRAKDNREARRTRWWLFGEPQPNLYKAIRGLPRVFCITRVSPHLCVAALPIGVVYSEQLFVLAFSTFGPFAVLQSRIHELWARAFSSSMKDDLRYTPSDCFRTFPFPEGFETDATLESVGAVYDAARSQLMIDRDEGLTKTYNRFHARAETAADVVRLRTLHAEVDVKVLNAYGWNDLAGRAAPVFLEQDFDEGTAPKTRFDWPPEFKNEVLTRLLSLNAERAAAERAAGLVASTSQHTEEFEDDGDSA